MEMTAKRIVGVAGVLGVVIPAIGVAIVPIWEFPGTLTTGSELREWVLDHQGRLQVVMVLNTLGVTLWLVFGAALRAHLRIRLDRASALPDLFGSGFASMVTLLLAGFTTFDVLVYRAASVPAADARLLYDVAFGLLAMSGMPAAVALGAYVVAVRRSRVASPALGWLAGVTAVAHVGLLASLVVPSGPWSLESWPITVVPAFLWAWILATGLTLLRGESPTAQASEEHPGAAK